MKRILVTAVLLLTMGQAIAHVPYLEPEMVRRIGPFLEDEDFSFNNPFVIEGDIMESRAVFAYLHRGDIDVYQFTVTPDMIGQHPVTGQPLPLINATALPPACRAYKRAYPVTALVGPGLPPPTVDLPFEVPPGEGVVYAPNPKVPRGEERAIFDFAPEGEYAWFLPLGLSMECLREAPWLCDFSNTISTPVFVPGTYKLVMWDPKGKAMDYTANLGFLEGLLGTDCDVEECTDEQIRAHERADVVTPMIDRFKMLRRPCRPPY